MKQVIVGTYEMGYEKVQLVLREGHGGEFYLLPGDIDDRCAAHHPAHIHGTLARSPDAHPAAADGRAYLALRSVVRVELARAPATRTGPRRHRRFHDPLPVPLLFRRRIVHLFPVLGLRDSDDEQD